MPRKPKTVFGQPNLLDVGVKSGPCVAPIGREVEAWRDGGYKGITNTTRTLFDHWFRPGGHRMGGGRTFLFHYAQKEAIETLVYLFEVKGIRRFKDLVETYASEPNIRLLQHDEFSRLAVKMATGSGKTVVMAMAVAWQFLNAVAEGREEYARNFLVVAPLVIVYERLRMDFANGAIFRRFPLIPDELRFWWELDFVTRDDPDRSYAPGALYLTNVQQLYDAPAPESKEADAMTGVLGLAPGPKGRVEEPFAERIVRREGGLLVINDEAHHTWDEDSEWNRAIRLIHARGEGLVGQLDFSATPRDQKGVLFSWTVYDYPLKKAILDGIVKRPLKGVGKGLQEVPSDIPSIRYQAYLTAGVERWKEYAAGLSPLNRKPVLFVMASKTTEADDIADYLRRSYPGEFGGDHTQVIHTDSSGKITNADLEVARRTVREVDDPKSPVRCIVSVLMLREGWDVQSVTVVVGLRPFAAAANVLPEQAIGRGLRLMFREMGIDYQERVDVIGTKKFMELIDQLEKDEAIDLDTFDVGGDKLTITSIFVDPEKMAMDIAVPRLTPILARKKTLAEEIASLDVRSFDVPVMPKKAQDLKSGTFFYEGIDVVTNEAVVSGEYRIPVPQTASEVVSYYAKRIAADMKLPSQFAALAPKVSEFLRHKAFGETVDLDAPEMLKAISSNVVSFVTIKAFGKALRPLITEELTPEIAGEDRMLSLTEPFPHGRQTVESPKTIFNKCPADNGFEETFAQFLHEAEDVARFSKLVKRFGFAIEYTDSANRLRFYEPDFVVVTTAGENVIVETKGQEDVDVAFKDRAARLWCEYASMLKGKDWRFLKVKQKEFKDLQPEEFADLLALD